MPSPETGKNESVMEYDMLSQKNMLGREAKGESGSRGWHNCIQTYIQQAVRCLVGWSMGASYSFNTRSRGTSSTEFSCSSHPTVGMALYSHTQVNNMTGPQGSSFRQHAQLNLADSGRSCLWPPGRWKRISFLETWNFTTATGDGQRIGSPDQKSSFFAPQEVENENIDSIRHGNTGSFGYLKDSEDSPEAELACLWWLRQHEGEKWGWSIFHFSQNRVRLKILSYESNCFREHHWVESLKI